MQALETYPSLRRQDLKPAIGTAISEPIAVLTQGAHADTIRSLIEERGVLVFRGLGMNDEDQLAFTRTLGVLVEEQNVFKISMDPKVNPLAEYSKGAFFWHIDGTRWTYRCSRRS